MKEVDESTCQSTLVYKNMRSDNPSLLSRFVAKMKNLIGRGGISYVSPESVNMKRLAFIRATEFFLYHQAVETIANEIIENLRHDLFAIRSGKKAQKSRLLHVKEEGKFQQEYDLLQVFLEHTKSVALLSDWEGGISQAYNHLIIDIHNRLEKIANITFHGKEITLFPVGKDRIVVFLESKNQLL